MPTNTPIPTVATGNVITAATQNDNTVLNTCIGLFAKDTSLAGAAPAVNAPNYQIIAGAPAISFTGGFGALVFGGGGFPNGLQSLVITVFTATGAVEASYYAPTKTGAEIVLEFNNVAYTGSAQISYIAIGF
jgi:hypothetical protein